MYRTLFVSSLCLALSGCATIGKGDFCFESHRLEYRVPLDGDQPLPCKSRELYNRLKEALT